MGMSARRLSLLVKVADARTEQAATELGRCQMRLAEQEQRLLELRTYLADYRAQPMPASMALIDNRERFLLRLVEAENQQLRAVTLAVAAVGQCTERWHLQRRNGETYESLHDHALGREQRVDGQRAQSALDDFALRAFVARRSGLGDPG